MKGLATLIRLRKQALDRECLAVAALERKKRDLLDDRRDLGRQLVQEIRQIQAAPDTARFLGCYLDGVRRRTDRIDAAVRRLQAERDAAGQRAQAAWRAWKSLDLHAEALRTAAQAEAACRERRAADERAIRQFAHPSLSGRRQA